MESAGERDQRVRRYQAHLVVWALAVAVIGFVIGRTLGFQFNLTADSAALVGYGFLGTVGAGALTIPVWILLDLVFRIYRRGD